MQQQLPQQEYNGNQQQMSQPMMLCPIQYVYETPMLVQPGISEEVQQQPYLINVHNPPPWINRQNIVYLQPNIQQIQPNIQQIQPNIQQIQPNIQQIQPNIQQIQPNMQHITPNIQPIYQNFQNQLYQHVNYVPQMMVPQEYRQIYQQNSEPEKMPILTQMLKTNVAQNIKPEIIRPIMQNQQVQTDIPGKPRPQVITINPMQQRFQKDFRPQLQGEIPNHIRNKIPSSISVKTVYRPILPRPVFRHEAQNLYYNNIATENTNFTPIANVKQEFKQFKNEESQTTKVSNVNTQEKIKSNSNESTVNEKVKRASETQTEEKLIRNTVFVQARGRVLEKELVINTLKRTLDDRLQENLAKTMSVESPKKYIKVETPHNNNLNVNSAKPVNNPNFQQITVPDNVNLRATEANVPENKIKTNLDTNISELDSLKNKLNHIEQKELNKTVKDAKDKVNQKKIKEENKQHKPKDKDTQKLIEAQNIKVEKENVKIKEETVFENVSKEEIKGKDKIKEDKIVILTHVLDGHIIQESNVAFPIQKPSKDNMEKDKNNQKSSPKSIKIDNKNDVIPLLPLSYQVLTKNVEEKEQEVEDSPFAKITKSMLRSWTTETLADHLSKYNWKETASKLLDQEIDGESLLLVNKEQLVIIGVCEEHADIISNFLCKN